MPTNDNEGVQEDAVVRDIYETFFDDLFDLLNTFLFLVVKTRSSMMVLGKFPPRKLPSGNLLLEKSHLGNLSP